MSAFVYSKATNRILGGCEAPDEQGHVPQITDYTAYGVVLVDDPEVEHALLYGQQDLYRVENVAVRLATADELAAAQPTNAERRTAIDAATAREDLTHIDLIVDHVPAMFAAAQAGTFDATAWRGTLRSALRQKRRKQQGL